MNRWLTPPTPGVTLVIGLTDQAPLLALLTELALRDGVHLIIGGNRLDGHQLAREVRRRTTAVDETMARIILKRPFTGYQLVAALTEATGHQPLLVTDMLTPFADESLSDGEARRLVQTAVFQLRGLAVDRPVLVTVRPPPGERAGLLRHLRSCAHTVYRR